MAVIPLRCRVSRGDDVAVITLGSLFDGIGGWLLAASHNNVKPLWSSEIDDFPSEVSHYHFPDVKQYGDITKLNGAELEPVDIICAGSPCQDLSLAGKRAGLAGERSGLFMEAVRIIREMREKTNGKYPKYFVWENVTGTFSSNRGQDFRAVLSEITEAEIPMPKSGKWAEAGVVRSPKCNVEWRTLDAQYWGVPQRRKRIFLVADFTGASAGEILFECEGLSRDSAESQREVQATSRYAEKSTRDTVGAVGFDGYNSALTGEKAATLGVNCGMSTGRNGILCAGAGAPKQQKSVRRLTPVECERLQGLPDGYTNIEFNGKPAPDSRRYKAIGNGMAQPCADYVIKRICLTAH